MKSVEQVKKHLGKIKGVSFGLGGYQECMLGISFGFEFDGSGVGDFHGWWDHNKINDEDSHDWTEADRDKHMADTMRFISGLLNDAKVDTVPQLQGVPVEVTMKGNCLDSWRILKEVI